MSNEHSNQLSEYLDGEMSPGERALVEARLADDPEASETLRELRAVVERAASFEDGMPATADAIWRGIAARIEGRAVGVPRPSVMGRIAPRRLRAVSISLPRAAAAAVALIALTGTGTWWIMRDANAPEAEPAGGAGVVVAASTGGAVTRFDEAVTDLERALTDERTRLAPETIRAVEENLAIIDQAIASAREALRLDPNSSFLQRHLEETTRQKLALLQRVTGLSRAL